MIRDAQSDGSSSEDAVQEKHLQTFLQEIRILVPGAQIVGGVLFSIPFQQRFERLTESQRVIFFATFVCTLAALALFVAPAAYHRLCAPVRERRKFVVLGTRFLLAGFVPLTVSTTLSVYLVTSLTLGGGAPAIVAAAFGTFLLACWWLPSLLRMHDWMRVPKDGASREAVPPPAHHRPAENR